MERLLKEEQAAIDLDMARNLLSDSKHPKAQEMAETLRSFIQDLQTWSKQ